MRCPRGEDILELQYFQCVILNPWSLYPERKYNIDYFKREFQWYLGADKYDTSICEHASMWKKLVQEDGSILSNYGQYWWGPQGGYFWVLDTLEKDPDSRQAYIPMNNYRHAFTGNKDFVCTKGIQFRINDDRLDMHVAMRSTDAVFGMGTDLPCFWFLWKMLAMDLETPTGKFVFSSDSVHIYERHFEMAERVVKDNRVWDSTVPVPILNDPEDLYQCRFKSKFGEWLMEAPL